MSNVQILYVGNDTLLEVDSVKNEVTGEFINDATVTVTLKDSDGVNVAGDTWPKTLSYVTGSDGMYRATLVYGLSLEAGKKYSAQVIVDAGTGLRAEWTMACAARLRG